MDHVLQGLDILACSGKEEAVRKYADAHGLPPEMRDTKATEAALYSRLSYLEEEFDDPFKEAEYFSGERFEKVFSATSNAYLLSEIARTVGSIDQGRSPYHDIESLLILVENPALVEAINRNLNNPRLSKEVAQMVRRGYQLLFDWNMAEYELSDPFETFPPVLDQWKHLVDMEAIAREAIGDMGTELDDIYDKNYWEGSEFKRVHLYKTLRKMAELMGREFVSREAFAEFKDSEHYEDIVKNSGLEVMGETPPQQSSQEKTVDEFGRRYFRLDSMDAKRLAELGKQLGEGGKKALAIALSQWFVAGRRNVVVDVAAFDGGRLYDHQTAKEGFSQAIETLYRQGDYRKLRPALNLPAFLIDDNPEIAGFTEARKFLQEGSQGE